QEIVWGVTGLGKRVADQAREHGKATLSANGKTVAPQPPPPGAKESDPSWALVRASEYKSLKISISDKGPGTLFLFLSSDGVREHEDFKTGGEGLKLSRRFLDKEGQGLNVEDGSVNLGDLIFVE